MGVVPPFAIREFASDADSMYFESARRLISSALMPISEYAFARMIAHQHAFAAYDRHSERLLGAALVRMTPDQTGFVPDGYSELTRIAVRRSMRGERAIGPALLAHSEQLAQQSNMVGLAAVPSDAAVPFYDRAGYTMQNNGMFLKSFV